MPINGEELIMQKPILSLVLGGIAASSLIVLSACGQGADTKDDPTGDASDMASVTVQEGSELSDDGEEIEAPGTEGATDATGGTVVPAEDGMTTEEEPDEVLEAGSAVEDTNYDADADTHVPSAPAYDDAEVISEEASTQQATQAPPVAVNSDAGKIVLQDTEENALRLVFYYNGDTITGLSSYMEYPSVEEAQLAASEITVGPEEQVKAVRVEGSCVVTDQTPEAYAGLTVSNLESEYPQMVRV